METMSKYGAKINRPLSEIVGLSTDTKPTDETEGVQIQNGSIFIEMDTGKKYMFDAENTQWKLMSSGSGGGGGGFTPTQEQLAAMNSGITAERLSDDENAIFEISTSSVKYPFNVVIGGVSDGGVPVSSTIRVRTDIIGCNVGIGTIHFPENTKHRFIFYTNNNSQFLEMSEWSSETEDTIVFPTISGGSSYNIGMRILCAYQDDSTITNDNIPYIYFVYTQSQDNIVPMTNGYFLDNSSPDTVGTNSAFKTTGLIPVQSGKSYKATKFRNTVLYDENMRSTRALKTDNIINNTVTVNSGEYYISFCCRKTDADEMCFAEADKFIEGNLPINLLGKKLSLLGDSISAYSGTIPQGNDAYYTGSNSGVTDSSQMWWNVLCRKTGMIPLVINGWSGSGITQLTDTDHSAKVPMSDTSRSQALHKSSTNPDIILIAGGVNDYSYAQQASQKPNNWDGTTTPIKGNSFDETYAVMIKDIQTAYPNAIVVCLSTWFTMRGTDNGYTLLNTEGLTQADYDSAIERVARIMRVPFISVDCCGFSRSNFYPTYAEDSSTIPTHPNKVGQKIMGNHIANVLPQIVKAFKS